MARPIKINAGDISINAELNDSETASRIFESLPISGKVNTWGDEIYFTIELNLPPENPKPLVEKGDIAYWPDGTAICLFFGPTPMSKGDEIRPASPVNIIGKILDDPAALKSANDGDEISMEEA
jgi:hypothetical protein